MLTRSQTGEPVRKALRQLVATALSLAVTAAVQAQTCDCSRRLAVCEATISASPRGSAGSYGADLLVRSSAPRCSRVDYYVDGTPYFNVLSNTNVVEDSVFGTSPILQSSISDIRCHVCASSEVTGKPGSGPLGQATSYYVEFGGSLANANHGKLANIIGQKFGVAATLMSSSGGAYVIRLGPVASASEADALLARMKASGGSAYQTGVVVSVQ